MRLIKEILFVEELVNKKTNKLYHRTTVLLDDGSEAVGYGDDFKVDDRVEVFYDPRWDVVKFRLPLTK